MHPEHLPCCCFALFSKTHLKKINFLLEKLNDNYTEQKCKSPHYLQNFRSWLQHLYIAMLLGPKVFVQLVLISGENKIPWSLA